MNSSIVLLLGFVLALLAAANPSRFLFYVGLVVNIPTILRITLLKFVIQKTAAYNLKMLEQSRFTIWLVVFMKANRYFISTESYLKDSIRWFLGNEENNMIKITKAKSTVEYTPVSERELTDGTQTVFVMRKLSRQRLAEIRDGLLGLSKRGTVDKVRSYTVRLQITREMIQDWRNIANEDGNLIPFDPTKRVDLYELLPEELVSELEARFGDGSLDYEEVERKIAEAEAEAALDSAIEEENDTEAAA